MSLVIDLALAQRVEAIHAASAVLYAEARARADPSSGARVVRHDEPPNGGAQGLVLTHGGTGGGANSSAAWQLGMHGAVTDDDVAAIERFFTALGMTARAEVSPYAHASLWAVLAARGWHLVRTSAVLAGDPRELVAPLTVSLADGAAVVRAGTVADVDAWLAVQTAAYPDVTRDVASMRAGIAPMFAAPSSATLAFVDGAPAAASGLVVTEHGAILMAGMTHPAHRGRGLQRALIDARIAEARARGCTLVVSSAEHGSTSERNLRRAGLVCVASSLRFERVPVSV